MLEDRREFSKAVVNGENVAQAASRQRLLEVITLQSLISTYKLAFFPSKTQVKCKDVRILHFAEDGFSLEGQ